MLRRICLLLTLLAPAVLPAVDVVPIPLAVDARYLTLQVAGALDINEGGTAELVQDACNRVTLSDLEVTPGVERVRATVTVRAATGADVMGQCVGPEMNGVLNFDLLPAVDPGGLAVAFEPSAVEWRAPDGTPALLSMPIRVVAENLVLPRLGSIRVDLSEPLAALDALVPDFVETPPGELAARGRIIDLNSVPDALVVSLGIPVSPRSSAVEGTEPPLDEAELAEWQRLEDELDGFLTVVIAYLAQTVESPRLRLELLGVLLDARHDIALALGENNVFGEDPVRALFVRSWDRLRPHLAELDVRHDELLFAGFVAGGDLIRALDALGPEYGLEITRDGLRRLARILLAGDAPPAFTPLPREVDPGLRALFGFDPVHDDHVPPLAAHPPRRRWLDFLVPSAHARILDDPAEALLDNLVPRLAELDEYLALVAELLEQEARERLSNGTKIPANYHAQLDPLVRATAWKESCWRQFIAGGETPRVLTSPVGAVGMMQVNGRVWRGVYDLERLRDNVRYNIAAGTEILEHYLVDYALRRGEHEHPGGADNLVRATYAAYNGGPSHLGRYRNDDTPGRLRAIDREFWRHYRTMKADGWPEVSSCYPV